MDIIIDSIADVSRYKSITFSIPYIPQKLANDVMKLVGVIISMIFIVIMKITEAAIMYFIKDKVFFISSL